MIVEFLNANFTKMHFINCLMETKESQTKTQNTFKLLNEQEGGCVSLDFTFDLKTSHCRINKHLMHL